MIKIVDEGENGDAADEQQALRRMIGVTQKIAAEKKILFAKRCLRDGLTLEQRELTARLFDDVRAITDKQGNDSSSLDMDALHDNSPN